MITVKIPLKERIEDILDHVGLKKLAKGRAYVNYAIQLYYADQEKYKRKFHKVLYSEVAEHYHTNGAAVEKNIRKALESAWRYGKPDALYDDYEAIISSTKGKPTASGFIIRTVEILKRLEE